MKLKSWFDVVKPREDLRQGKPLDASEFAVQLDKVRLKTAPIDYRDPKRFFDRTYLTENLIGLAGEVARRLSGITTETSAVFNMTTPFGGGKTHALTLLYHIAENGSKANGLRGVSKILEKAQIKSLADKCAVAVFVGTEFDSITGRGGTDGTPLRKTPWGEIAFQLGGPEAFAYVAKHDAEFIEPKGDVIDKFLPHDRPSLILMDEVLSYFSTYRERHYSTKLYNFIQTLSETVRSRNNAALVVSVPKSDYAYTQDDVADQQRIKNLLDRLSKAVILSVEADASEIIRRRLFEWDDEAVTADGRVLLPKEAVETCKAYAEWVQEHRQQLPNLINPDLAREQFLATYPFHPMVISVFERKWQTLPRFQKTRGILRLLALWVSRAYQEGYKGAQHDPLITLGTAPLEDPIFRAAVFEQLGETNLEGAVTSDIAGKKDAFSIRLDSEAIDAIKKARLHRKIATTIFFESNGGQIGEESKEASDPEIRLAVGDPDVDIGNIETALEALTDACYYLVVEKKRYKFSLKENLNKRFSDRRASIPHPQIEEFVRSEVQKVFSAGTGVERVYFPEKSSSVADRAVLTFVVLAPEISLQDDKKTRQIIDSMTKENGNSARTFKSALIWCVPDSSASLREEARKVLAWEAIDDEKDELKFDESQRRQLVESLKKAQRDMREAVWRTYKHIALLDKDNSSRVMDLGLVHSSQSPDGTMVGYLLQRLRQDGIVELGISPNFLPRKWPPAFKEWSTKSVRDAFFASPQFPKLLKGETIKETISRGVSGGILGYVGKKGAEYNPFIYEKDLNPTDVEISEDMFIITKETAENYKRAKTVIGAAVTTPAAPTPSLTEPPDEPIPTPLPANVTRIEWSGDVPHQKWMNFYTKVLSRFATSGNLKISMKVEISQPDGISQQKIEEMKVALKELGLGDDIQSH